jgi:hypothetical protein
MNYNKEDVNFKFSYVQDYDISKIKGIVETLEQEWKIDVSRQKLFTVHKHTESYIINKVSLDWQPYTDLIAISQAQTNELSKLALDIAKDLENKLDGKMGQVLFIKLEAGKSIDKHIDGGEYLECVARHHIPIITNPSVAFIIGGESKHLREGECWEISNIKEHAVVNNGNADRIHLLIDIVPNKFLPSKKGKNESN